MRMVALVATFSQVVETVIVTQGQTPLQEGRASVPLLHHFESQAHCSQVFTRSGCLASNKMSDYKGYTKEEGGAI
jgi:hypothetical protein